MKSKAILLLAIVTSTALFAAVITPYNKAKPPTLSLPQAFEKALAALGSETNDLHCLEAKVDGVFSKDGEWLFTFYNIDAKPKWVTVEFNGKIHVEDIRLR